MPGKETGSVTKSEERMLELTRTFDAPREEVWKAWTDPQRMLRWWAPKGFTTPVCTVDLRPGGMFRYCMRSPEGQEYWGRGVYREIVEPERLVYMDSFTDAAGKPVPPTHYGFSASHPAQTLVTVNLSEVVGRTRLTLRHAIPESTKEFGEAREGWGQMLDKLADRLTSPEFTSTKLNA
jgi:uncharacterized protein YndB with AHSA1/START domain